MQGRGKIPHSFARIGYRPGQILQQSGLAVDPGSGSLYEASYIRLQRLALGGGISRILEPLIEFLHDSLGEAIQIHPGLGNLFFYLPYGSCAPGGFLIVTSECEACGLYG